MLLNLLADLPAGPLPEELFTTLAQAGGARVERIVSTGQASPEGFWYDQGWDEFILLVQGAAGLETEGQGVRTLGPGDCALIPARTRHRVAWTGAAGPTVWLAVHFPAAGGGP